MPTTLLARTPRISTRFFTIGTYTIISYTDSIVNISRRTRKRKRRDVPVLQPPSKNITKSNPNKTNAYDIARTHATHLDTVLYHRYTNPN